MVYWQKHLGMFMGYKLNHWTNVKSMILLFHLLPGCSTMLPPHWCRCGWRDETCSRVEVSHLYSSTLHRREREREGEQWGRGQRGHMIPNLSELVPDQLLSHVAMEMEGGNNWEWKGRWGQWATIKDKGLQTGSKSTPMFAVLQNSYLPWCEHFNRLKKKEESGENF